LTSVAVTCAADVLQVISVPRTWTFAPSLTEALQSASLVVFAEPTHLKLAADAMTSTGTLERPLTVNLKAADEPERTLPSSSMPWPTVPPFMTQLELVVASFDSGLSTLSSTTTSTEAPVT
jgi:hypothetical protein